MYIYVCNLLKLHIIRINLLDMIDIISEINKTLEKCNFNVSYTYKLKIKFFNINLKFH